MSKRYKLIRISRDEYLTLGRAGVWVYAAGNNCDESPLVPFAASETVRWSRCWEDTEGYPFLYTRVEVLDGSDA